MPRSIASVLPSAHHVYLPAAACSACLGFTIAIQPVTGACAVCGPACAGATDTTHSGRSSAGPTGRGSRSGQNYPVVFSLSQCHLENRGALRAVVSRDRRRTRVLTASEGDRLLTIALDARRVTSSGDASSGVRTRRRCITRTTRRRQPPRQMTTASLSSSPISVWQPSRPTARTDGRCHWDRSRASTACLRRRHHEDLVVLLCDQRSGSF